MKIYSQNNIRNIFFKIILPSILTVAVFVFAMFFIFIPLLENQKIEGKKEMIKELTNTNWSILNKYENDVKNGLLTESEAQQRAVSEIQVIRYGDENMDYFWITDLHPNMIMHPYRTDLIGSDLSDFEDYTGEKMFVEFVEVAKSFGSGYVDYMWQWKDDSTKIVPKLSYVKFYEPWGWIVGTGIYVEDVKQEIAVLKSNVIKISILIFIVFVLLFSVIIWQSLKIEKQRAAAEKSLVESREKYKTLVEASIEGSLMILDGKIIYSNQIILDLLSYSSDEIKNCGFEEIFPDLKFDSLLKLEQKSLETKILTNYSQVIDVLVHVSNFNIQNKHGITLIINDLRKESLIKEELKEKNERLKSITNNFNIGIFRATFGKRSQFIDANFEAARILGYKEVSELYDKNIFDLFLDSEEKRDFITELNEQKSLKNKTIRIHKEDGSFSVISVSAVLTKNTEGEFAFCDGIIEDISSFKSRETQQENLIAELQTAQFFVNQSVKLICEPAPKCNFSDSVKTVSGIMLKQNASAVFVTAENDKILGIVTERDFNKRVISAGLTTESLISEIMSAPVYSISEDTFVFEAILQMDEKNIRHLAVKNNNQQIVGMISQEIISQLQFKSYSFLLKNIQNAKNTVDLISVHKRLPVLIKALIDSGIDAKNITGIMSKVSDAITRKILEFGIEKFGIPPTEFAFLALGSEGRQEQTLKTDQDNAIVYNLLPNSDEEHIKSYFLKLAEFVNDNLNEIGYKYCKGEVMAMNPKWTNSLEKWKNYFKKWITESEPQALLELSIFFDLRCIYGNEQIVTDLQTFVYQTLENNPPFYIFMSDNVLSYKSPLNIFGNIIVGEGQSKSETFNIKEVMMFFSSFARLYALKTAETVSNTLDRLETVKNNKFIPEKTYNELKDDYIYLMQIRLKNQANQISLNLEPDNDIKPDQLSSIEIMQLKNILRRISVMRTQISLDFKGVSR
ncbi:MAG: cache domain-containing protein [Bacteroidales bacterium]|nr:cache domain-containing protein [Bacteroidales bacterium]